MKEREARREGKTREEGSSGMRDQVAHAPRLPELTNPDDGGCPEPLSIQHCLVCCLCSCVGKELAVTRERPTNNAADALQEVMKNRLGPVDSHAACWSVDPPAPLDCFLLFDHGSSHCPLVFPSSSSLVPSLSLIFLTLGSLSLKYLGCINVSNNKTYKLCIHFYT